MYCCLFFQFRYKLGHVSAFWRIYDKFILFFCWLVQHGWIYTCSQLSRQQATSNSTRDGRLASSRVIYSQCLPGWTEKKDNVTKDKSRPSRICIKQKETYILRETRQIQSVTFEALPLLCWSLQVATLCRLALGRRFLQSIKLRKQKRQDVD